MTGYPVEGVFEIVRKFFLKRKLQGLTGNEKKFIRFFQEENIPLVGALQGRIFLGGFFVDVSRSTSYPKGSFAYLVQAKARRLEFQAGVGVFKGKKAYNWAYCLDVTSWDQV